MGSKFESGYAGGKVGGHENSSDIKRAAIGRFFGSLRSFFPAKNIYPLPLVILRKDRRRFRSPSVHLQGIGTDRIHPADILMPDRKLFFSSFLPCPIAGTGRFRKCLLRSSPFQAVRFDSRGGKVHPVRQYIPLDSRSG